MLDQVRFKIAASSVDAGAARFLAESRRSRKTSSPVGVRRLHVLVGESAFVTLRRAYLAEPTSPRSPDDARPNRQSALRKWLNRANDAESIARLDDSDLIDTAEAEEPRTLAEAQAVATRGRHLLQGVKRGPNIEPRPALCDVMTR